MGKKLRATTATGQKKTEKQKRIMYHFMKREHVRVFEPFKPEKDIKQIICTPNFIPVRGSSLPHYKYDIDYHFKFSLKKHRPNVVVQCHNSGTWHTKMKKYGMKIVYVGHGVWDASPANVKRSFSETWANFDLLLGGIHNFRTLLMNNANVPSEKIVLNALPQFDVLYDRVQQRDEHRRALLENSPAYKIVAMFGHKYGRSDFIAHSVDFYSSVVKLARLAEKNNWLLVVKPKKENTFSFIEQKAKDNEPWAVGVIDEFMSLRESPHVKFAAPFGDPYPLIAATDVVILSGRSTIELEACLANKPLIIVRVADNVFAGGNDNLDTIKNNCAYHVDNLDVLDEVVLTAVNSDNATQLQNQNAHTANLGLTFDGKHHQRALKAIRGLVE